MIQSGIHLDMEDKDYFGVNASTSSSLTIPPFSRILEIFGRPFDGIQSIDYFQYDLSLRITGTIEFVGIFLTLRIPLWTVFNSGETWHW
ncbi:Uncharacterized protein TCM_021730 [Theobroma cacao]|uniref:Uncharacterized protein n=1 Tax=Theobroma cacao TaxID=3641 RepID=A0A061ESA8_THECC|nr:Uncharacterized protein TCM_021730 [Theobroma cacao]